MKKLSRLLLPLCLVGLFIVGCKNKDASNNGRETVQFDKVGNWEILGQKTPLYINFSENDSKGECAWQILINNDFNGEPQFCYSDYEICKDMEPGSVSIDFGGIQLEGEVSEIIIDGENLINLDSETNVVNGVLPVLSKGNFDIAITNTKTGEQRIRYIGNETAQAEEAYNKLIQLKKQ